MAKKKKSTARTAPRAVAAPAAAAAPKPAGPNPLLEILKRPMLLLACFSAGLAVFAAAAALYYRDNMEMGAIREPTGMILLAAIALTLFASYHRHRSRANKPGS
jgi:hypothetical protein